MKELREQIDKIDALIIKKVAQRIGIAKKIGKIKSQSNKKVFDKKRENYLEKLYRTLSKKHKLDEKFIKAIFKSIIIYSRSVQK